MNSPRRSTRRVFVLLLVSILLSAAHQGYAQAPPSNTIDPKDMADITIRSGNQLRGDLDKLMTADRNVRAAVAYFEQRKLRIHSDGLFEARFRKVSTNENFSMFFIALTDAPPTPTVQNLVLWTQGPRGASRTWAGTISIEKEVEVKEDHAVVDGKVQAGQGRLKSWLKCSLIGCGPAAAGCLRGGPTWLACFGLWCGGGILTCGALELMNP